MRIALRQLRVVLRVFETVIGARRADALIAETQWISDELGLARDFDVFLETIEQSSGRKRRRRLVPAARRALDRARRELYRRVAKALRSARYLRLLGDIRATVAGRAPSPGEAAGTRKRVDRFAARELHRRRRRFVKVARRLPSLNSQQQHRLRIRGRKLRYAMEFLRDAYPGQKSHRRLRAAVATLRRLQHALGALHDLSRQRTLRHLYLPRGAASLGTVPTAEGAGDARHRAERLLRAALRAIDEFEATKPFWT